MDGFDTRELDAYTEKLLGIANHDMPKKSKQFIRKEGRKLKSRTLSTARKKVKRNTGNYHKAIKCGKAYVYKGNDGTSIRVYSSAPHAHLIEDGHRQVTKDGKEVGFVSGKHVFETAAKEFEQTYYEDIDGFLDDVFDKGVGG